MISGNNSDDNLSAQSERDDIFGGDGNDQINGRSRSDQLLGEIGNDTINGDDGNDTARKSKVKSIIFRTYATGIFFF